MDKVLSLSEEKPLEFEEVKEKEMELAEVSFYEGKVSEEITNDDLENMYALAQEMVKFAHARNGAGLTLPQIGILKEDLFSLLAITNGNSCSIQNSLQQVKSHMFMRDHYHMMELTLLKDSKRLMPYIIL